MVYFSSRLQLLWDVGQGRLVSEQLGTYLTPGRAWFSESLFLESKLPRSRRETLGLGDFSGIVNLWPRCRPLLGDWGSGPDDPSFAGLP